MKMIVFVAALAFISLGANVSVASARSAPSVEQTVVEHGGGCRKASRPRCCHMETRTGVVHCH